MNCQTMHSGMIWHNVTDNFRLVAEGGYTEKTWYLADAIKKIHSVALVPSSSGRISLTLLKVFIKKRESIELSLFF